MSSAERRKGMRAFLLIGSSNFLKDIRRESFKTCFLRIWRDAAHFNEASKSITTSPRTSNGLARWSPLESEAIITSLPVSTGVSAALISLLSAWTHGNEEGTSRQPRRGWRDVPSSLPWVQALNNEMRAADTPVLTGKEVIIASDSSGLHRASPFEVLGLVVIDFDASLKWAASRQILRKHVLKDSRRMSFKKLDEPMRRNALIPFLRSADDIQGMCLCVGIHKGITTLGGPPELHQQLTQTQILKASWSQASFDRMSRTAHFISLII